MSKFAVIVVAEPAGRYWGEVPALPECYSQGETVDELRASLREAIAAVLEVMQEGLAGGHVHGSSRRDRFDDGNGRIKPSGPQSGRRVSVSPRAPRTKRTQALRRMLREENA